VCVFLFVPRPYSLLGFPFFDMSSTKETEGKADPSSTQEQRHLRPGAIRETPTLFSNTLPVVSVGVSESVMRDLANRGKKDEVAFHRGRAGERIMKEVPYPETSKLDEDMIFDSTGLPRLNLIRAHFMKEGLFSSHVWRFVFQIAFFILIYRKID